MRRLRPWRECWACDSPGPTAWSGSFPFIRASRGGRLVMRFLITVAGLLVVTGTPARVCVARASVRPVVLQDADPFSPLDRTVSLALDRVPLKAALDAVARQTGENGSASCKTTGRTLAR